MGTGDDLGRFIAVQDALAAPALGADVHVWAIDLDSLTGKVDPGVLGPLERAKAERFVFAPDRNRYVAAHVALRTVLAGYAGQAPDELDITETPQGKPYLLGGGPVFNLSHSAGSALVAVAAEGHVGVDLEQVVPRHDELGIARSLFARSDVEWLEGMDDSARRIAFHRIWACREAVLKAAGTGLAGTGLEIDFGPDGKAHVIRLPDEFDVDLVIREFTPSRGYTGAVAWTPGNPLANALLFGFSVPDSQKTS